MLPARVSPTIPAPSAFQRFPSARYKVTASAEGFKSAVQTVDVQAGAVIQANFKLTIGQRTETVEVEGSAPLVELSPNNNNYVDNGEDRKRSAQRTRFQFAAGHHSRACNGTPGGGFLAISINGCAPLPTITSSTVLYNNDRYYGDSAIGQTGIVGIPAVISLPTRSRN